jgi:hypothetical protein
MVYYQIAFVIVAVIAIVIYALWSRGKLNTFNAPQLNSRPIYIVLEGCRQTKIKKNQLELTIRQGPTCSLCFTSNENLMWCSEGLNVDCKNLTTVINLETGVITQYDNFTDTVYRTFTLEFISTMLSPEIPPSMSSPF